MNNINPSLNSAFKYGFGFFETMRSIGSRIIFFDEHINRLNSSLKYFDLTEVNRNEILEEIQREIKIKKFKDTRIRITYSLQNDKPLINFEFSPYRNPFPENAKITFSNYLLKHSDELRKHKTTNYFINYYEYQKATTLGFNEVIFCDDRGHILEGSRTNIFFIFYDKDFKNLQILTPNTECGLLNGIGRQKVIEICHQNNLKVKETTITHKQISRAKEIFLTNSLHGIIPIVISNKKHKMPITQKLKQQFDHFFKI